MAVKTQIDVAVDNAAFTEFASAFAKYEAALKGLPAVWASAEKSTAKTRSNFEATAISVGVLGGSIASVTARSKEFYQVTTATARYWKDLALSTHNVARNIIATTELLMKWTGIVSLITGGAGLFGFDRLAGNVANQRSAAFGTGGTRAGRIAFTSNFRRMGDPESLLGRVAGMQADMRQSQPLRALGLSTEDIRSLSPEDATMKALQGGTIFAAEDKARGMPVGSDPRLRAFTTPEQIWLRDHRAEINELIAKTRAEKAAGRFMLNPAEEKAAQDFETNMTKAGQAIETSFVKGLVKLAAPLGELSDSVVKLVASFTEKALPDIVKDLGEGIEWLAKEVEFPGFVKEVESLASMIGSLASAFGGILGGLANFARWLGIASPGTSGGGINPAHAQASSPSSGGGGGTGSGYGVHGQSRDQFLTGPAHARGGTGAASSAATGGHPTTGGGAASGGESPEVVAYIRQAAIARGIDPDVALRAARSEGLRGFDPAAGHWSSGYNDAGTSWGPFQEHIHSNIRGQTAYGLGDDMLAAGIDPRRMENWHAGVDYALDTAARKHSWRDWHGMNRHPANEGLERAHRVVIQSTPGGNTSLGSGAAAVGSS